MAIKAKSSQEIFRAPQGSQKKTKVTHTLSLSILEVPSYSLWFWFSSFRTLIAIITSFQDTPPEYNVSAVAVPTALYWAGHDVLADPEDVKSLMSKLHCETYNKYIEEWEHLDFIWAIDATTEVYNDIIKHILSKEKWIGKSWK